MLTPLTNADPPKGAFLCTRVFPTPRHFTVTDELVPAGLPVVCLEPALLDACRAAGYDPQANLAEFLTLPGFGLSVTANLMDGVSGAF